MAARIMREMMLQEIGWFFRLVVLVLFTVFALISAIFLVSRRMNSRVESSGESSRPLRQLSQAFAPKKRKQKRGISKKQERTEKIKSGVAWLLEKTDWLLYDKLKLLPDARTGRHVNYFFMLFTAWLVPTIMFWLLGHEVIIEIELMRELSVELPTEYLLSLLGSAALAVLFVFITAFPIFLILRRNREFYFDLCALFSLLGVAAYKLIFCFNNGCCFGIPWEWGVYNARLGTIVFPIQLFEFGTGILLAVVCILFMIYSKRYRPGRGASFSMLAYAVPRFFWSFLRYDNDVHWATEAEWPFGLTVVQVVCVVTVVIAIVWWFLIPLEKKLADGLRALVLRGLRKLAVWLYFSPRLHPFLSKRLGWYDGVAKLEEAEGV